MSSYIHIKGADGKLYRQPVTVRTPRSSGVPALVIPHVQSVTAAVRKTAATSHSDQSTGSTKTITDLSGFDIDAWGVYRIKGCVGVQFTSTQLVASFPVAFGRCGGTCLLLEDFPADPSSSLFSFDINATSVTVASLTSAIASWIQFEFVYSAYDTGGTLDFKTVTGDAGNCLVFNGSWIEAEKLSTFTDHSS